MSDARTWGNFNDALSPANEGNYSPGVLKGTGSNEGWKKKNIYDLAGNLIEWTNEKKISNGDTILRSNGYNGIGSFTGPEYFWTGGEFSWGHVGFRPCLYLE